jgi:hypothetical protein
MTTLYQAQHQQQQQHQQPNTANTDGWILYYSPEGFPYYYNEITGESQWAEHEQEISEVEDNTDKYDEQNEEYAIKDPSSRLNRAEDDDDDDEEDDDDDDDDDDTSETTETEESASATEDDGFDKEFQAYLASPEGQLELEVGR